MNSGLAVDSNNFKQELKVENYLFACFLFFLPFSQALTIGLFFPLKVYELALLFFLIAKLTTLKGVKIPTSKIFLTTYVFLTIAFISILINGFYKYDYEPSIDLVRTSPFFDSLLKFIYLLLAVFGFIISYVELSKNPKQIKYFFLGTTIACCYCWYLFVSGILRIPIIRLPGMDPIPQSISLSFGEIVRCGTAKEGNFMALFLIIAGVIAHQFKHKRECMFYFFSVITTFSTIGMFCIIVYFILVAVFNNSISKAKIVIAVSFICISITIISSISEDFRYLVINKVAGTAETVDNQNDILSKLDRLNSSEIGLEMFSDNVFFGVGMSNYSIHYNHYNELPNFEADFKRIPNDIYVEVLSESGLFAFLAFIFLFVNAFVLTKGNEFIYLKAGLIVMLIYFFTFPTYTMLFIWFFLAVIASAKRVLDDSNASIRTRANYVM